MEQIELRQLQETELEILIDFDEYCRENELKYFLIGGALLGAARYQKFIPWDDDIDVAMPREDYERLKSEYSSKRYFLQNSESDPDFSRCIQKIRKNGTKIIENTCKNIEIHQGIYIDIFPIDYVDEANSKKLSQRGFIIRGLMSLRAIKGGYENGRYVWLKRMIRWLCPVSAHFIDKKLDRLCTIENHATKKYAILWLHNYPWYRQIHESGVFGDGCLCEFEGKHFNAPSNPNAFLRRVFGEDYLLEPKKEKQKMPHNYLQVYFGDKEDG